MTVYIMQVSVIGAGSQLMTYIGGTYSTETQAEKAAAELMEKDTDVIGWELIETELDAPVVLTF